MLHNLDKLMDYSKLLDKAILAVRTDIMGVDFKCPIMMERLNVRVTYTHNYDDPYLVVTMVFFNRQIAVFKLDLHEDSRAFRVVSSNLSNRNTNGDKCDMVTPFNKMKNFLVESGFDAK